MNNLSDDYRFNRAEAAKYLGVSPGTMAVWASTGRYNLPFLKIGKKVSYFKRDLDDFISANMRGDAA